MHRPGKGALCRSVREVSCWRHETETLSARCLVSSSAFAQANVIVYAVADASFDVVRIGGDAQNELGNTTRVFISASYLGFKGAEVLGLGLSVVFQFEGSVGFDNSGTLGTRRESATPSDPA